MKWKQKTATIPIETAPNTVPTEEEECVEQERFEFWHRFCENKTAVFGLVVLVLIILMAVFANFITDPANVTFQDMNARSLSPSLEHPFGTDGFGRDIFARIIYGARSSLFIAFATIAISCLAGLIFGVSCGYFGGRFDTIVMLHRRCVHVSAAAAVLSVHRGSAGQRHGQPHFGRQYHHDALFHPCHPGHGHVGHVHGLHRGCPRRGREPSAHHPAHVIPNCMGPIIVEATISLSMMIMLAASLSFIGMGVQPPSPEWGAMLSDAREYMRDSPWMVLAPGLAIMITSLAFNLLGDGVRDALDPRMKK